MIALGLKSAGEKRHAEAIAIFEQAYEAAVQHDGVESVLAAHALMHIGLTESIASRGDGAIVLDRAVDLFVKLHGETDAKTARLIRFIAWGLSVDSAEHPSTPGLLDQAFLRGRAAVALGDRIGDLGVETFMLRGNLSMLATALGEHALACDETSRLFETLARAEPDAKLNGVLACWWHARAHVAAGRGGEAIGYLEETIARCVASEKRTGRVVRTVPELRELLDQARAQAARQPT